MIKEFDFKLLFSVLKIAASLDVFSNQCVMRKITVDESIFPTPITENFEKVFVSKNLITIIRK